MEELDPITRSIMFYMYLQGWMYGKFENLEKWSNEDLIKFKDKFDNQVIPSLNSDHNNCLDIKVQCARCIVDRLYKQAARIYDVSLGVNNA